MMISNFNYDDLKLKKTLISMTCTKNISALWRLTLYHLETYIVLLELEGFKLPLYKVAAYNLLTSRGRYMRRFTMVDDIPWEVKGFYAPHDFVISINSNDYKIINSITTNAVLMPGQCRRRWSNIRKALGTIFSYICYTILV